jgi:hypothetical protein
MVLVKIAGLWTEILMWESVEYDARFSNRAMQLFVIQNISYGIFKNL